MPKKTRTKSLRKKINEQLLCEQNQWYEGIITQPTSNQLKNFQERRQQAIQLLANKNIPETFLYRDKQVDQINSFINGCLTDKINCRILLVTGSPGAGKTLSVSTVLKKRQEKYLKYNANVIKSIKDIQNFIYQQLVEDNSENQTGALQIIRQIQKQWRTKKQNKCAKKSCIVFIEEIELLFKTTSELLISDFLSMFSHKNIHLILIGTSNSIDFLQKYEDRTHSKMPSIKNVVFRPYNSAMVKQILMQKIALIKQKTLIEIDFPDKLLNFAAKKIENIKKGDIRFALEFFRSLIWDLLHKKYNPAAEKQIINMDLVNKAFIKLNDSKDSLIGALPFEQQMLLIAFFVHIKRTEAIQITSKDLSYDLKWVCDCLKITMKKQIFNGLVELGDYGFISKRLKNGNQKLLLKLSLTEIEMSFSQHAVFGKFFQAQEGKVQ